jgi:hypothetical protein
VNASVTDVFVARDTETAVGAPGAVGVCVINGAETCEASDVPTEFLALTRTLYAVDGVRLLITYGAEAEVSVEVAVSHVAKLLLEYSTEYAVMVSPPSDIGAVKLTARLVYVALERTG